MKKGIVFLMLCAGLFGVTANASNITVSNVGRTVTVTAKIDAEAKATMFFVKKGEQITNNDALLAVKQAQANDDGTVTFLFNVPADTETKTYNGEYTVYARQSGGAELEPVNYVYVSDAGKALLNTSLTGVSGKDELMQQLVADENQLALLAEGFNVPDYVNGDKDEIATLADGAIGSYAGKSNEEISEIFNKAVAVSYISDGASSTEFLAKGGFSFKGVKYSDESNEKQQWIANLVQGKQYQAIASAEADYEKLNMLYNLNNARLNEIEGLLSSYRNTLQSGCEDVYIQYFSLTSKDKVNEGIVRSLKNNPVSTPQALGVVISSAMGNGNGGTSSGGGASGGSSSGGQSSAGGLSLNIIPQPPQSASKEKLFDDIDSALWAETAIRTAVERKIVSGDGSGNFYPNKPVTREEFVKMLVSALGVYDATVECDFRDVNKGAWYYPYVATAYKLGLVYGKDNGSFGIGADISRQDMTVMLYRAIDRMNISLTDIKASHNFDDKADIAGYAIDAIEALYKAGVVNGVGDNRFDPNGTATRAQAVQIIYNLLFK